MDKTLVIIQSNYIPWKGYFDLLINADHIVIYDTVQYTKNDWRNRNKIKTANGLKWLTIPVQHESLSQKICEIKINDKDWYKKHLDIIYQSYRSLPYFNTFFKELKNVYYSLDGEYSLSVINICLINFILEYIGKPKILDHSKNYDLSGEKTEKLIKLCDLTGCNRYLSGPSAKSYIDHNLFASNHIMLDYIDYSSYKEYSQIYPPFEHGISVIDLFFHLGSSTLEYIKNDK